LTERDTARAGTQAGGVGEGEAGFPRSGEPDVGLDPRTWYHELKADAWRLGHPGAPRQLFIKIERPSQLGK